MKSLELQIYKIFWVLWVRMCSSLKQTKMLAFAYWLCYGNIMLTEEFKNE